MAYIQSAYLGDEKSSQNITKVLNERISDNKIDVTVNSGLMPMFEVTDKVELSQNDEDEIAQEAEKQCGSANDNECITATKARLRRSKLEEKELQQQSSAYLIKGRRLTVNYIDEKGKKRTAIVPEGQQFKLENLKPLKQPVAPGQKPQFETPSLVPSFGSTVLEFTKIGTIIVSVFLYAFSVVATYKTFIQSGYKWGGYAATAASVFFPYSGYVIMLVFFAVKEYIALKNKG